MKEILSFFIIFTEPICILMAIVSFLLYAFSKEKAQIRHSIWMHVFLFFMMIQALVIITWAFVLAVGKGGVI